MLCVSVVKFLEEKIHHRDTEVTQRTTETNFPTDSLRKQGVNEMDLQIPGALKLVG